MALPRWILPSFSGVQAYPSGTASVSNNSHTLVSFDTENFDTDTYHSISSNTSRFIAPATGTYFFLGRAAFSTGTVATQLWIRKNAAGSSAGGTAIARQTSVPVSTGTHAWQISGVVQLTASDYLEMFVWQNSGGTLTLQAGPELTSFTMYRLA